MISKPESAFAASSGEPNGSLKTVTSAAALTLDQSAIVSATFW